MKIIILVLLVSTLSSAIATPGFLNGGHFIPSTNIVSSRTIVGTAVGGGPTSGAVSTAQYSQTVPAPATVQTIITSHPSPAVGYAAGVPANSGVPSTSGGGGGYAYTSVPQGPATGSAPGGYGVQGQGSSSGGSRNPGYNQHQTSYYNQRYY